MATITTDLICNLNQPVAATFLHGNLFSQDNAGNTINVYVMDNGVPATIGGTVSANVIRADGNTVAVSGAIEGNKAYVILPQACYAVPGRVEIIIKLTQSTTITTIAAIVANVYRSTTDTVVDPGTIIPSIQTLIAEIEEAVDSIPVDYSGLLATIAADYSSSKTYPVVGTYAWQGGVLKRNIVPITTAETYTAEHWTNVVLGDDVSALKSAVDDVTNSSFEDTSDISVSWTTGGYYRITDGAFVENSSYSYAEISIANGEKYVHFIGTPLYYACGIIFMNGTAKVGDSVPSASSTTPINGNFEIPSGATKIRISKYNKPCSIAYSKKVYTLDLPPVSYNMLDDNLKGNIDTLNGSVQVLENKMDNSGLFYKKSGVSSDWQQGLYGASSGIYDSAHSNAICTKNYISREEKYLYKISCLTTYKFRLQAWNGSDVYQGIWNGTTFTTTNPNYFLTEIKLRDFFASYPTYNFKLVMFASDGSSNVVPSDAQYTFKTYVLLEKQEDIDNTINGQRDYTIYCDWEIGSIFAASGADYDGVTRGIRTKNNKKIFIETDSIASSYNSSIVTVYAFKFSTDGVFLERIGTDGNKTVNLPGGYLYRFLLLAPTGTVITSDTINNYSSDFYACGKMLGGILLQLHSTEAYVSGKCIGADLIARDIKAKRFGTGAIKYAQSFCIYNNKIYSTNGSSIAVQSTSFEVEQDVSLSVGHGNAFVLGNNGKGYISGWDDNKVYVVDLSTLTITNTISLPTTGYTTCAVDDVKGLLYIFQRDTSPSTEEQYNFIVYDYINEEIKGTYQTSIAFGAMQACDIYHDKIIVLNGAGTGSLPNGYRVYDLRGNILADYYFSSFSTLEPEGVCVDRESGIMYICFIDAAVYTIESA